MATSLQARCANRQPRLELTALMDVMFLVLVFFIYAVFDMAVHKGVKVDLPSAQGTLEKGERIVITIPRDNTLQLNGRPLPQNAIVRETQRLLALRPETPVLVSGDRQAALGTGVELLSALKHAGIEHVSFQVKGAREP